MMTWRRPLFSRVIGAEDFHEAEEEAVHGAEAVYRAMAVHQHSIWHPGGGLVLAGSSGQRPTSDFQNLKS